MYGMYFFICDTVYIYALFRFRMSDKIISKYQITDTF